MSGLLALGPTDQWIAHWREDDGELVGFLVPTDEGYVPVTLFGYVLGEASDHHDAVYVLESHGLSYLAERWWLRRGEGWVAVQIVEASPERVVVSSVDFGDDAEYGERFALDAPVGDDVLTMR